MHAWWLWLLFAVGVGPAPIDPEVIVLVFDPTTRTSAGLWLGDDEAAPTEVFRVHAGGLWAQAGGGAAKAANGEPAATVGYTRGSPAATAELVDALSPDRAPWTAAARVGPSGPATFEGHAVEGITVHYDARVVVLGRGVSRAWVHALGRQLGAVEQDPIDLLLHAMPWIVEQWSRRGPRSAVLATVGSTRAPETIAVAGRGHVVTRLHRAHLVHLADVEVPFQRERLRKRCPEPAEACASARHALLGAARRALQVFPDDPALHEAIAEAEAFDR